MSNEIKVKIHVCKRKIRNGTNPMLVASWMATLNKVEGRIKWQN